MFVLGVSKLSFVYAYKKGNNSIVRFILGARNIDSYLFKDEAYLGERTSLMFRWILIAVVMAFILVTFFWGNRNEAFLSFIPAGIFLIYNLYLRYLVKHNKNLYFLRYFSVTIDILALSSHIYINSIHFSSIAASTTASIFIYPVLMFLAVLRYDKKLIIYATALTIITFNTNYYLHYHTIDPELIKLVASSDPMGQVYKSGYLLLLGLFFLNVPDMIFRFISRQQDAMEEKNEFVLNLWMEKKEKNLLKDNLKDLNQLHQELTQKTTKIEDQNNKLNELVQTKDRLISFISHDLKNSFSTMASIIETTQQNASNMDSEDIIEAMGILFKHSVNNHILFENLLQWAKLQRGQLAVRKEKIELREFCLQAYKACREQIKAKELKLDIVIDEDCIVLADRLMLNSVCNNILGNAIKFTPRGKNITVQVSNGTNNVSISIHDEGVGIKKERIPEIFSIENSRTTNGTEGEKGSGFGLILCKELIERNGGEISLKSEEGHGSCFTIKLPKGSNKLN